MDEFQNSTEYLVQVVGVLEVPGTYNHDKQNMTSLFSILCYFHTLRQSYKKCLSSSKSMLTLLDTNPSPIFL